MEKTDARYLVSPGFIRILRRATERLKEEFDSFETSMDDKRIVYLNALFASQIQILESFQTTLEQRQSIAIPLVARSFFEAYVDFKNLYMDPTYLRQIFASQLEQRRSTLVSLRDNELIEKEKVEPSIQEISNQKVRFNITRRELKRTIREKFEKANLKDVYIIVYKALSMYVHHNMAALEHRHIRSFEENLSLSADSMYQYELELYWAKRLSVCLELAYEWICDANCNAMDRGTVQTLKSLTKALEHELGTKKTITN